MLKLSSNKNKFHISDDANLGSRSICLKVTKNQKLPIPLRHQHALLLEMNKDVGADWPAILLKDQQIAHPKNQNFILLDPGLDYVDEGDILILYPNESRIKVIYRRDANANSFLVTERCNSFCVMCSQPPRDIDDGYLVDEILSSIPLIDRSTAEIGITGGEPTLIGSGFHQIVRKLKNYLPNTAVHVLSNGRSLKDLNACLDIAKLRHPDLMFGIPLYADYSQLHNFIVQADNAFDDTIRGILNLKRCQQKVEIRVVIHKQNYSRLAKLADFISRNLLFVDHVAFMGLEIMGFARANLGALWIDPYFYKDHLEESLGILKRNGVSASVYNLPLCLLGEAGKQHSVRSISDWKQEYLTECEECERRSECAGFFFSSKIKYSEHIKAIKSL